MSDPDQPPSIPLEIDPELRGRVRVGIASAAPVVTAAAAPALIREMESCEAELRREHEGRTPAQIADLAPARELYRSFGMDPTKTRPSSEALLRRILKGKSLPRILNAVDVCNLLAVRFLLPLGLYDATKIRGGARLRPGAPSESYPGIRKADVHLSGRPVLADDVGPFGNPSSDSLRTSVDAGTGALWMVIFAPASFPVSRMEAHVETARETMARHLAPPDETVATLGAMVE